MTNEDLVSRGSNECWGTYNSSTGNGYGAGYKNSCIHSGTIKTSGDLPTSWYNYALASAGTISEDTDSSHFASNIEKATESICPKGWTLPDATQGYSTRNNVTDFSPVKGGTYENGNSYNSTTNGAWWTSNSVNGGTPIDLVSRSYVYYNGNTNTLQLSGFFPNGGLRYYGFYIRCVPAP